MWYNFLAEHDDDLPRIEGSVGAGFVLGAAPGFTVPLLAGSLILVAMGTGRPGPWGHVLDGVFEGSLALTARAAGLAIGTPAPPPLAPLVRGYAAGFQRQPTFKLLV